MSLLLLGGAMARAAELPDPVGSAAIEPAMDQVLGGADGRAALDQGDHAWGEGARGQARAAWRSAAKDRDPAVRAQAEIRLLQVSGSIGIAVHGPRASRALDACPDRQPWCLVAAAELELMARGLGLPGDLDRAELLLRAAGPALPEPTLARQVWAGSLPASALPPDPVDPVAQVLADHGGAWPRGPGTWLVGLGVAGARGAGFGGAIRFVHPDLGWTATRLEVEAALSSRLAGGLRGSIQTAGDRFALASIAALRTRADLYDSDGVMVGEEDSWTTSLAPGLGIRRGLLAVWAGPLARADRTEGVWLQGHGAFGGIRLGTRSASATLRSSASIWDTPHVGLDLDLRGVRHWGERALAGRIFGAWVPYSEAPAWRLPAMGGGEVLRSGPLGRFRGAELAGAVLEWRQPLLPALSAVAFVEGAWLEGPHGGLGGGIRLRLPPQPENTIRVDLGWGDGGLGLSVGWGEAF